jgi:precorrin-6B methylase 1
VTAADHEPAMITLAGAGLRGAWHLSREAEAAVRRARAVFYSTTNAGIAEHVRTLNGTATLRSTEQNEYRIGDYRPDMYRRMAALVLDAAAEGPGIVVLCPGSAMVVDLVSQLVLEGAQRLGLSVVVLPGISSVETVLAAVGYDVAEGVQVVLAQNLVLRRLELSPAIASIVMQPAYFDTRFFLGGPRSLEGRFDALQAQLGRSLSPRAPMAFVVTPTELGSEATLFWFRLANFGQLHRVLSPQHTLFVPPEQPASIDEGFRARIESWDACLAHVERSSGTAHGVRATGTATMIPQQKRRDAAARTAELPAELRDEASLLAERWRMRARS